MNDCSPPSAAGHLEPYGVRVRLRPVDRSLEIAPLLEALLEGIASSCIQAGATLIGHIKCVLHTERGLLLCNLTSLRSGATVRGDGPRALAPGEEAELDLAVLVYGLRAETIERLVAGALQELLLPAGAVLDTRRPFH